MFILDFDKPALKTYADTLTPELLKFWEGHQNMEMAYRCCMSLAFIGTFIVTYVK